MNYLEHLTLSNGLLFLLYFLSLIVGGRVSAQFTEQASAMGVQHVYIDIGEGAGLSLVDFNGDGFDDLTLATGNGQWLSTYVSTPDGLQLIFPQGLDQLQGAVRSINWIDFDNDGDKDLFVTMLNYTMGGWQGGFHLFRQEGGLIFTDHTAASGIVMEGLESYGSVWADYDNDGLLDLHVSNYGDGTEPASNYLFRNQGDGTFLSLAESLGLTDENGRSFVSVFFDADMDGVLDLFTANDREDSFNRFYRGIAGGAFVDQSIESNLYTEFEAMGVDVGDYDNDGDLDLFVTNAYALNLAPFLGNILFQNDGSAHFTAFPGFPSEVEYGTFWGCNFIDYDYDRDLDIFTVCSAFIDGQSSRFMYLNDGTGGYVEYPGAEFDGNPSNLSGTAQGDLNQDGFLDLIVLNIITGTSEIWIGPETDNGHIGIRLEGTISNRDGIGAVIEVWADGESRIDQTSTCNGFSSQDSDTYRFGLGQSARADSVVVKWPSGLVNVVWDIPADTQLEIVETSDYLIDCIPSAQIEYELSPGLDGVFAITDLLNVDSLELVWTLDGDSIGNGTQVAYSFDSFGTYSICVQLSSPCISFDICELLVLECPEAEASFTLNIENLNVSLENLSDSSNEVEWYIDGLFYGNEDQLEIELPGPGEYTLCQVALNSCGADTSCVPVVAECLTPFPDVDWYSPSDLILFANLSTAYDSVLWYIDGQVVSSADFDYQFSLPGEYELCVSVWDQCGSDSTCVNVEVDCTALNANFSFTQDSLTIQVADQSIGDSVSWTLNGVAIEIGEDSLIELVGPGAYELCVITSNLCGIEVYCDSIYGDFNTDLVDWLRLEERIELWPNPAQDEVFLQSGMNFTEIELFDMSGRQVRVTVFTNTAKAKLIDVSGLENGVYGLILHTDKGFHVSKLVINH